MTLKHYKIYINTDEDDDKTYTVCLVHPTSSEFTLCGDSIDNTPDGNPVETNENINCEFCLKTIKVIKEF